LDGGWGALHDAEKFLIFGLNDPELITRAISIKAEAMQKLGAGYHTLYLYRRNGLKFSPATKKPLGELAWDYFLNQPTARRMHRKPKDRDSLDHLQANLLKGMEENYAWLGQHWPDSRYVVITLSFDSQGEKPKRPWIEGWRCVYEPAAVAWHKRFYSPTTREGLAPAHRRLQFRNRLELAVGAVDVGDAECHLWLMVDESDGSVFRREEFVVLRHDLLLPGLIEFGTARSRDS